LRITIELIIHEIRVQVCIFDKILK